MSLSFPQWSVSVLASFINVFFLGAISPWKDFAPLFPERAPGRSSPALAPLSFVGGGE